MCLIPCDKVKEEITHENEVSWKWSDKHIVEGIEWFLFYSNNQERGAQGEDLHSSVVDFPKWVLLDSSFLHSWDGLTAESLWLISNESVVVF